MSVAGRGSTVSAVRASVRTSVSGGCAVSSVATAMHRDAGHVGHAGSAADEQVSSALGRRGLGSVRVHHRNSVSTVTAAVTSMASGRGVSSVGSSSSVTAGSVATSVAGRSWGGISSVATAVAGLGRLVLGRGCWGVVGQGSDQGGGQDDQGAELVHDDAGFFWW
uniref:(northern house mosquito) hypothetical protein n=1 Tax=Culex pipiens TaxID=7175 RepID=A0A8D8KWB1_CULPI